MTITRRVSPITDIWLQKKGYGVENLDKPRNNGATALILATQEQAIDAAAYVYHKGIQVIFSH